MRARAREFTLFAYQLAGYFYYASRHVARSFKTINSLGAITKAFLQSPKSECSKSYRVEIHFGTMVNYVENLYCNQLE